VPSLRTVLLDQPQRLLKGASGRVLAAFEQWSA
jgi:hypothetical protein